MGDETRLSIFARRYGYRDAFSQVHKVEVNGKRVPHVAAVAFRCDAETDGIEATLTFRVDAADLVVTTEMLASEADSEAST